MIFDLLYEENIISKDVFMKWKQEVREEGAEADNEPATQANPNYA